MRAALVIARKDLRQRIRDRSAIIVGLVAPLAVAALMSAAFHGTARFHMTIGVVNDDRGPVAAGFESLVRSADLRALLTVRTMPSRAVAARAVRSGDLDAAFVLPSGFSASVASGVPGEIAVLTTTNARIAGQVAQSIAAGYGAQVDADRLSVVTAMGAAAPATDAGRLATRAARLTIPETVTQRSTSVTPLSTISYYAPAMSIFFALFAVAFASRSFFAERRTGMLDRINAAPVTATVILFGKVLAVFAYSLASLLTVLLVSASFFGASWGSPGGVLALSVAMTIAVMALTALVITFARTEEQAQTLSSIVVFALAVLGGNFVTLSQAPALLRRVALLTPNGWALRGFLDLATGARSPRHVVEPVVGMLVFSAVVAVLAATRARRAVTA